MFVYFLSIEKALLRLLTHHIINSAYFKEMESKKGKENDRLYPYVSL